MLLLPPFCVVVCHHRLPISHISRRPPFNLSIDNATTTSVSRLSHYDGATTASEHDSFDTPTHKNP